MNFSECKFPLKKTIFVIEYEDSHTFYEMPAFQTKNRSLCFSFIKNMGISENDIQKMIKSKRLTIRRAPKKIPHKPYVALVFKNPNSSSSSFRVSDTNYSNWPIIENQNESKDTIVISDSDSDEKLSLKKRKKYTKENNSDIQPQPRKYIQLSDSDSDSDTELDADDFDLQKKAQLKKRKKHIVLPESEDDDNEPPDSDSDTELDADDFDLQKKAQLKKRKKHIVLPESEDDDSDIQPQPRKYIQLSDSDSDLDSDSDSNTELNADDFDLLKEARLKKRKKHIVSLESDDDDDDDEKIKISSKNDAELLELAIKLSLEEAEIKRVAQQKANEENEIQRLKDQEKHVEKQLKLLKARILNRRILKVMKKKKEQAQKIIAHRKATLNKTTTTLEEKKSQVGKTLSQILRKFKRCIEKDEEANESVQFQSSPLKNSIGVVDFQVVEKKSSISGKWFYGIAGKATLQPEIRELLPLTYNVDKNGRESNSKPRFLGTMWYYYHNPTNRDVLMKYAQCTNRINKLFKQINMIEEKPPYLTREMSNGILGWHIPCPIPDWINNLTITSQNKEDRLNLFNKFKRSEWNPKLNPTLTLAGTYTFGKCSINQQVFSASCDYLKLSDEKKWEHLYPLSLSFRFKNKRWYWFESHANGYHSYHQDPGPIFDHVLKFKINLAFQINWTGHSRFAYLDFNKKIVYVFDPWMQTLDQKSSQGGKGFHLLKGELLKKGLTLKFEKRKKDQGSEGSCIAMSMVRVLLMALYGLRGASMYPPCEIVVLTSRLISMFRKHHSKK